MNVAIPRLQAILDRVNKSGNISIADLASDIKVSEQTIRRDVRKLEGMNLLSRYHGGITKAKSQNLVNRDLQLRQQSNVSEKEAIARAVADLIPEGSTVFITIGTTVERIAAALSSKKSLTVITDSLRVAAIIYGNPNIEVMIPSGTLRAGNGGIEGPNTIMNLSEFRADFAITSVGAIDLDGSLLDFNITEVNAAKTMMKNAKSVIIACDHTKFKSVAPVKLGHLSECDCLITDQDLDPDLQNVAEQAGARVVIAKP